MNRRKGIIAVLAGACAALIGDRAKAQDVDVKTSGSNIGYVNLSPPILQFNLDDYKPGATVIRLTLGSRKVELTRDDIMDALYPPTQPDKP